MPLRVSQPTPLPTPDAMTIAPAREKLLPFHWLEQDDENWCWIACCKMVFDQDGPAGTSQCDIATTVLNVDCCADPDCEECNQPGDPARAFSKYDYACLSQPGRLAPDDIRSRIKSDQPVQVYYSYSDHAHVALVTGYHADGSFEVLDPYYGAGARSYSEICNAYGTGGSWTSSFVGIRKIDTGPWALG